MFKSFIKEIDINLKWWNRKRIFLLIVLIAWGYVCQQISLISVERGGTILVALLEIACSFVFLWLVLLLVSPRQHLLHPHCEKQDMLCTKSIVESWVKTAAYTERTSGILRSMAISCIVAIVVFMHFFSLNVGNTIIWISTLLAVGSIYCSLRTHLFLRGFYHAKDSVLFDNADNERKKIMHSMLQKMVCINRAFQRQYVLLICCVSSALLYFAVNIGPIGKTLSPEDRRTERIMKNLFGLLQNYETKKMLRELPEMLDTAYRTIRDEKSRMGMRDENGRTVFSNQAFKLVIRQFEEVVRELEFRERHCHNMTEVILMLQQHPDLKEKINLLRENIQAMQPFFMVVPMMEYQLHEIMVSNEIKNEPEDYFSTEKVEKRMQDIQKHSSVILSNLSREERLASFLWHLYNGSDVPCNDRALLIMDPDGLVTFDFRCGMISPVCWTNCSSDTKQLIFSLLCNRNLIHFNGDYVLGAWHQYLRAKRGCFSFIVMDDC